jgi:hypothetical protein
MRLDKEDTEYKKYPSTVDGVAESGTVLVRVHSSTRPVYTYSIHVRTVVVYLDEMPIDENIFSRHFVALLLFFASRQTGARVTTSSQLIPFVSFHCL